MKHLRILILLVLIIIVSISSCQKSKTISTGIITPRLIFQTQDQDEAYSFTAARDITVDQDSALYIFDYLDNFIKKYDSNGNHLQTFGKKGNNPGEFHHLTGIKATQDKLLAVDSLGLLTFSLQGEFLEKRQYAAEVLVDHPAIFSDGSFIGQQIVASELKTVLTYRSAEGNELDRLASYDIQEYFPEISEGEDFFLSLEQAPFYCYAFNPNGEIIWAESGAFNIYRYKDGMSQPFISAVYTPIPFPDDIRQNMLEQKSKISPPLFMYVPDKYQLIHQLMTEADGDIWIYLKSQEKTGFLLYSAQGEQKGFYSVQADFDMTKIKTRIFNDRMYFLVTGRKFAKVYVSDLPASE